jgi:hypothetical protein
VGRAEPDPSCSSGQAGCGALTVRQLRRPSSRQHAHAGGTSRVLGQDILNSLVRWFGVLGTTPEIAWAGQACFRLWVRTSGCVAICLPRLSLSARCPSPGWRVCFAERYL